MKAVRAHKSSASDLRFARSGAALSVPDALAQQATELTS
jgi:hypothetical protein